MCQLEKTWFIEDFEVYITVTVEHPSGEVTVTVESNCPLLENIRIHTEAETFICNNNDSSTYKIMGSEQCDIISSNFHSEIIAEFSPTENGQQVFLNGHIGVGNVVSLCRLETVNDDIENDFTRERLAQLDEDPRYYWVEDQTYIYY